MMRQIGRNRGLAFLLAGGALSALVATPAVAQDSDAGDADEIVVTAQHRTERLQDVPISAEVIGGEDRIESNINSMFDLQEQAPSVHVALSGRGNSISMRGVGSGTNSSFDQSVPSFVDDVYHGRSRSTFSTFLDLDRIEVLKGPQTLYSGNNAIGGAFNIITARPTAEPAGWVRALYGEDGQYAWEGAGGGPLTDELGVRLAFGFNGTDGWVRNVNTGQHAPAQEGAAGRITVAYQPTDNFDVTLKVEGSDTSNDTGFHLQVDKCPAEAPFNPAGAGACVAYIANNWPTNPQNDEYISSAGQLVDISTFDSVLTANYSMGGHTLTSVTGYYDYWFDLNFDADGLPTAVTHTQQAEGYDQISQEFRITSPTGQTIEYLAGVYFHRGDLDYASYTTVFPRGNLPALLAFGRGTIGQGLLYDQVEESESVFGALTWNVDERLSLTAGVRGTRVSKEFDYDLYYGGLSGSYGPIADDLTDPQNATAAAQYGSTPGAQSGSREDDAWMPSARIQYQFNEDAMAYGSYSRGFKAGGFNSAFTASATTPFTLDRISFGPETVDAYEAGLKSQWLDRSVTLNVALFRSEYEGLQVSHNELNASGTGFVGIVRNAAASVSQGVELETNWVVTQDFTLSASVTYLDSYYEDFQNVSLTPLQTIQRAPALAACVLANGATSPVCDPIRFQDLSGEPTQFAPQFSGTISGEHTAHFGDFDLTTHLSAYMSSTYTYSDNDDARKNQEAFARLDGRVTLDLPGGGWAIDLIGQNLTDEDILTFVTDVPGAAGSLFVQYQQPRNFAAQVRYSW